LRASPLIFSHHYVTAREQQTGDAAAVTPVSQERVVHANATEAPFDLPGP
jgi:hypothetical protein